MGGAPKVTSCETGFYDVHNFISGYYLFVIYLYLSTYMHVGTDMKYEVDAATT